MTDDDFDDFDEDKPKRQRAAPDPELQAMSTLVRAMNPLDEFQRGRVVDWFTARYADTGPQPATARMDGQPDRQLGGDRPFDVSAGVGADR
jgi:hypothetical protein